MKCQRCGHLKSQHRILPDDTSCMFCDCPSFVKRIELPIEGTVEFWDLGREKAKGSFEVRAVDNDDLQGQLVSEFRKHLISIEVSANRGNIYAGIHVVGHYKIKKR